MKRVLAILLVLLVLVTLLLIFRGRKSSNLESVEIEPKNLTDIRVAEPQRVDYQATFEIYTRGTKRIFTAPMYHNLSEDVYIQADEPSVVFVKKKGVTWDDFFKTLPFSVTSNCLITGTKETYCNDETETLNFYLNDQKISDALSRQIQNGDHLVIRFE